MFAQSITLNLPAVNKQAVIVSVALVVAAVLASIVVEVITRHYNKKQLQKFADDAKKYSKAATAVLLTIVSTAFTYLGYLLFLAQNNQDALSAIPFVGKHVAAVVGIAYVIYNVRLNKTYKHVADLLGKWSSSKPTTPPAIVTAPETPVQSVVPSPDEPFA